jgi:hypothetical protein
VNPRAILDAVEKITFLALAGESNSSDPVRSPSLYQQSYPEIREVPLPSGVLEPDQFLKMKNVKNML